MRRTGRGWDRVGSVAGMSADDVRNPLADDFGGRDVSAALHVGASSCCATPKPPEPHGANSRSCCFAATPDGIAAAQWIEIDADRPVGVERYRQYQPPRCSPANRKDGKNDPTICVIGGVAVWSRKRGRRQVSCRCELRRFAVEVKRLGGAGNEAVIESWTGGITHQPRGRFRRDRRDPRGFWCRAAGRVRRQSRR